MWLVLRHGEAEPLVSTDEARALTDRGREQARKSAMFVRELGLRPVVMSSPLLRARQTAEELMAVLGCQAPLLICPAATPDGDVEETIGYLERSGADCVLLASHMPFVSRFVSWLVDGTRREDYPFPLAGLRVLESGVWLPGQARERDSYFP